MRPSCDGRCVPARNTLTIDKKLCGVGSQNSHALHHTINQQLGKLDIHSPCCFIAYVGVL